MNALQIIQKKLKAPKSQYNSFGKYHYRNCEDIQEAVKPLLEETNSVLTLTDEIVEVGGSLFVKATATLSWYATENRVLTSTTTAFAMHAKEQKGMNEAQITGSASSYARKYALNGLFLIDDTKDADTTNQHDKKAPATPAKTPKPKADPKPLELKVTAKEELTPTHKSWEYAKRRIEQGVTLEQIRQTFVVSEDNAKLLCQSQEQKTTSASVKD